MDESFYAEQYKFMYLPLLTIYVLFMSIQTQYQHSSRHHVVFNSIILLGHPGKYINNEFVGSFKICQSISLSMLPLEWLRIEKQLMGPLFLLHVMS